MQGTVFLLYLGIIKHYTMQPYTLDHDNQKNSNSSVSVGFSSDLSALQEGIHGLINNQERFSLFNKPEWYASWLRAYTNKSTIRILLAKKDQELVGCLPLWRIKFGIQDLGFKIIETISGNKADYQTPIIKTGNDSDVLPHLISAALKLIGKFGLLSLPHIPENTATIQILRTYLQKNNIHFTESTSTCPFLAFATTYEQTEKNLPKSLRIDVRRQTKRLIEKGELKLWVASTPDEIKAKLNDFFAAYRQKWVSQSKPDPLSNPNAKKQMSALVDLLWGKGLHFSTLQLNGEDISYHFGFEYANWLMWYRPTYKIEFENYSPSKVHISFLIKDGIHRGLTGIDFLQGTENYKLQWTDTKTTTTSFLITKSRWSPAFIWFSCLKPWLITVVGKFYVTVKARINK